MNNRFNRKHSLLSKKVLRLNAFAMGCIMATFFNSHFSFSQSVFTPQTFQGKEGRLSYQILWPASFSKHKKYPLVLFLHGSGERGSDNEKQLVHGARLFLDEENQKKYPAIVLFPQCPGEGFWAKTDFSGGKSGLTFMDYEAPTTAMSIVLNLLDSLLDQPFVDNDRVYLGGLSMGGMGTFELLARRPNVFAAAFPICGGGNPSSAKKYAGKVKLWVFHGAKDDVLYPDYSTEMVLALIKAGDRPKYTLYGDANHNSWDSAFAEPNLLPWLFNTSKQQ